MGGRCRGSVGCSKLNLASIKQHSRERSRKAGSEGCLLPTPSMCSAQEPSPPHGVCSEWWAAWEAHKVGQNTPPPARGTEPRDVNPSYPFIAKPKRCLQSHSAEQERDESEWST